MTVGQGYDLSREIAYAMLNHFADEALGPAVRRYYAAHDKKKESYDHYGRVSGRDRYNKEVV